MHSHLLLRFMMCQADHLPDVRAFFASCRHTPSVLHVFLSEFAFPVATRSQMMKLSASGHDLLAAESIFGARLGFTGTPNDLAPDGVKVQYDAPAEASIFRALTAVSVFSTEVLHNWTIMRALMCVARDVESTVRSSTPTLPFHALIDVGALITGLSNKEVAAALLTLGLEGIDGVVYFSTSCVASTTPI
jgi:hypothetical protein